MAVARFPGRGPGPRPAFVSLPGGARDAAAAARPRDGQAGLVIWAAWAGAALLVILVGRVQPAGLPAPLVLPLVAVVMEFSPRLGWTVAFLGAAGALSVGAGYPAGVILAASLLMRLLRSHVLQEAEGVVHRRRLQAATLAGAVLVAGGVLAWPFGPFGLELDRLAGVMVTAILAVMALPWMRQAVTLLLRALPGAADILAEEAEGRDLPPVEPAPARRAMAALLVVAAGGLDGVRLLALDAGLALRVLCILLAAEVGGAGWGAVAGTGAGLLGLLAGQGAGWTVAWMALAGTAAGLMQRYGRPALVAGFLLATLIMAGSVPVVEAAAVMIASGAAGLAGYAAITATGMPRQLAGRLQALSPPVAPPAAGRESAPGRDEGAHAAWRVMEDLLREMARTVERPAGSQADHREQVSELINDVARRHCLHCPHARTCWQAEFGTTYQAMLDILSTLERGERAREVIVPPPLRARCPRLPAITDALAQGLELLQLELRWQRRVNRMRHLVAEQLRGLAEVAATLERGRAAATNRRSGGWRYGMRVGVARTPKEGRWVSGDGYLCRSFEDERRMVLVLSDGMGSGRRAAAESRAALHLLERLLDAGVPAEAAIRILNAALALRGEEMYTTLDVASVDLERGQVEFIKVGAAPSFVRSERDVRLITRPALPVGMFDDIEVTGDRGYLRPGDLLVMVSDGVLSAFGDVEAGAAWIRGFLAGLTEDEPRCVATQIIKEALRRAGNRAGDDMTVLAGKLVSRGQLASVAGLDCAR
ncbi:MAG TPA: SpoIIE family protein phosphatase [Thermaerobacter sp.]